MIDAEKILGGMLKNSMGDMGGLGGRAAVGMGLLGIAIAAAEHFMERSERRPQVPPPPGGPARVPEMPVSSPPPPPPPGASSPAAGPPPVPGMPQPPAENPSNTGRDGSQALLLIRAMIASANADGHIDEEEKRRIMLRLETLDLSDSERQFMERELSCPMSVDAIVGETSSPELARKVYAVSLLAIDLDTEAEKRYLRRLAEGLNLDGDSLDEIHGRLGIPRP